MKKKHLMMLLIVVMGQRWSVMADIEGDYEYSKSDGKVTITKYVGSETDIIIPDTLGGNPVAAIGDSAFYGCMSLRSVVMPPSLRAVGRCAFQYCSGIMQIGFQGRPPETVGNNAFYYMSDNLVIRYPWQQREAWYAEMDADKNWNGYKTNIYYPCPPDKHFTYEQISGSPEYLMITGFDKSYTDPFEIPSRHEERWILAVGANVFSDAKMPIVIMPDCFYVIGPGAFKNCSELTTLRLSKVMETIYYDAFNGCKLLAAINIPDTLESIGDRAFLGCEKLSAVEFPEGFSELGKRAFAGCSALAKITFNGPPPKTKGDEAFAGIAANAVGYYLSDYELEWGEVLDADNKWQGVKMVMMERPKVEVSGVLSASQTWNRKNIYRITGDVTIPSGVTLTIEAGAIIKFDSLKSIMVNSGATLQANGTRMRPVIFTSIKDDEYGGDTNEDGDASKPAAGDWRKITVYGRANFNFAKLLYGAYGNSTDDMILISGGTVYFDNGLIAHGGKYAIGVESGHFYMKNSVITDCYCAFRHWPSDEIVNSVIWACNRLSNNSGQKFRNCVLGDFSEAWDWNNGSGNTYNNCVLWNPANYSLQKNTVNANWNNNIWGNPKFVNAANGNFHLRKDSPCIDAGDDEYAPELDADGYPRQGVSDIGPYEFIPDNAVSDVDLEIGTVTAPTSAKVGDVVTVSWAVKNIGVADAVGSRRDTVELVAENGAVVELGTVTIFGGLASKASATASGKFRIPAVREGRHTVRVTVNSGRDIYEGSLTANNIGAASTTLAVTVPECALTDGHCSLALSDGQSTAIRVPTGGAAGLVVLKSAGDLAAWLGNGQTPTADNHIGSAVSLGGGCWLLAVPADTDAYLAIQNESGKDATAELSFAVGAFQVVDTGIITAANSGTLSVKIYGNGFESGMAVALVQGANRITASEVVVKDAVSCTATFNVNGAQLGDWSIRVTKGSEEIAGSKVTLRKSTAGAKWDCNLVIASSVRQEREYVGTFVYANTGDAAMDVPYVRLTAKNGTLIRFSEADAWSEELELMAVSGSYPASKLKPGEEVRIPFFYKTTSTMCQIKYGWTEADSKAFPWDTNSQYMRPSWATDEMWTLALATLKSRIGATWNDYLARMRANADHLMKIGVSPVWRLDRIWQLEINEALGVDHAVSTLASATDLARSGRGFGLALSRTYGSGMFQRLRKGIFGYGWSDNYSLYAELSEDRMTFSVQLPVGSAVAFRKINNWWYSESGHDTTTLTETATDYVMTSEKGATLTIAKSNMRIREMKDNMGRTLTFTWSGTKLSKIQHSDGQWLSFTYFGDLLTKAVDDQGRTVSYEYTGDMLTAVTGSTGLRTTYKYKASDATPLSGALIQIVYPDGTTKDYTYDADGRIASISLNGNQQTTRIVRQPLGSYTVVGPDGGEVAVTVGVSGEVLTSVNALGETTRLVYTADGQLESVVSSSGKRTKLSYDADGNIAQTVGADGTLTSFLYGGEFGALSSVVDARQNSVKYEYDEFGRATAVVYADGTSEAVEYAANGDVTASVNRRGDRITRTYDTAGRPLTKVWPDGRTFRWFYDAKGNCTNATDSVTGAVTMEYDANERMTRIAYPKGRGFTYQYDAYGRVTKRTAHDGTAQGYEYDLLGRLKQVKVGNKIYLTNIYDAQTGRLDAQTYGNGTQVVYAYDELGRVTEIKHLGKDNKVLETFAYTYDKDGRRSALTTAEGTESYRYDDAGQLIGVTYPDGSSESFAYDAVGNRITANGAAYTVNAMNQYLAVSGDNAAEYAYDADGNLVSRSGSDGETRYYYDCENRLVAATNTTSGLAWSCAYDVFGNRVSVTDNGVTTERLFVGGEQPSVAAEYGADGALKTQHILVGATLLADEGANGTRYYHADGLASTRLLTDANGAVKGRMNYKAFGETRKTSGETVNNGYVGTLGIEHDPTGLLFMRNRYYSTDLGRFMQMDPSGLDGGDVNLYRYCGNNTTENMDYIGCKKVYVGMKARPLAGETPPNQGIRNAFLQGASFYAAEHHHIFVYDDCGRLVKDFGWHNNGAGINKNTGELNNIFSDEKYYSWYGDFRGNVIEIDEQNLNEVMDVLRKVLENTKYSLWNYDGINCQAFALAVTRLLELKGGKKVAQVPQSCDPNEINGSVGIGEQRYVEKGEWLEYTIYFENKTNATAAAAEVRVTEMLDANLDWSTLELGEVAFNNQIDIGLNGKRPGSVKKPAQTTLSFSGTAYQVRTEASLDEQTGKLHWYLRIVDPSTRDGWPEDAFAGLLPPNDETHRGEGHLTYRVRVRDTATDGAVVRASADIVFDHNEVIKTDPSWWNTVGTVATVKLEGFDDRILIAGKPFGKLPEPTRDGYKFNGWFTGKDGAERKSPHRPLCQVLICRFIRIGRFFHDLTRSSGRGRWPKRPHRS